jgi:hypothetical protein
LISGFRRDVDEAALFWDIMRRRVVIFIDVSGQRIGPIFTGQESFLLGLLTCEDGTDTFSRNVGKLLTTRSRVIFRKSSDLMKVVSSKRRDQTIH